MIRFGLIGYGGIARTVIDTLAGNGQAKNRDSTLSGVLIRPDRPQPDAPGVPFVTSLEALIEARPDVIGECAGHHALQTLGPAVLNAGIDLVAMSVGALADAGFYGELVAAAEAGHARLILPAGAIGAVDALSAASLGDLTRVCYRSRKPPRAWLGSPAGECCDLLALKEEAVLYAGSAREAARLYPKNANVAATVALAGLGFEATEVELVADPAVTENVHEIEAEGTFGSFSIRLAGRPSPANPRTSMLTALSMSRALANAGPIVII